MKWGAYMAGETERKFLIEPEIYTGAAGSHKETHYKVYIYENGIDKYDYLLPTLNDAFSFIEEKYGLPHDAWNISE